MAYGAANFTYLEAITQFNQNTVFDSLLSAFKSFICYFGSFLLFYTGFSRTETVFDAHAKSREQTFGCR